MRWVDLREAAASGARSSEVTRGTPGPQALAVPHRRRLAWWMQSNRPATGCRTERKPPSRGADRPADAKPGTGNPTPAVLYTTGPGATHLGTAPGVRDQVAALDYHPGSGSWAVRPG